MSDNIRNSQGVDAILGDPKKALWKMSIPLIISLLITSLYSVIDAIWVSGLGADALAGDCPSNINVIADAPALRSLCDPVKAPDCPAALQRQVYPACIAV